MPAEGVPYHGATEHTDDETAPVVTRGRALSASAIKAVEAGIVAKARHATTAYISHMDAWATDAMLGLPKPVDVQTNTAAIAQLGPLLVEKRNEELRVEQLEAALEACTQETDVADKTRIEHQLKVTRRRRDAVAAKIDASLAHLEATVRRAAEGISEGLARDEAAYDAAIRRMAKAEPGVLDEASAIAAELNNCGPLKPGAVVEVVVGGGDGAKMAKARVVRADGNDGNGNGGGAAGIHVEDLSFMV